MISFIILHYKNLNDTLEAIDSIRKNCSKNNKIVVVDNATLKKEEIKFLEKKCDKLIINKENLGFAKANNIGCSYATKNFEPDFLCVINNDIVITQKNFDKKIQLIYNETPFDILGPKILTNGGDSVNPFPVYKSEEEIKHAIKNSRMWITIYQNAFLRFLYSIYKKIKKTPNKIYENASSQMEDVGLHGCSLIFSKRYYKKYKDVFYNETFLYHEEEFLYERSRQDNLKMIYNPDIELFHKEGASLNSSFNKDYQKMIFKHKEIINSLEKLLTFRK